jgi:signal transduction histidine kinase
MASATSLAPHWSRREAGQSVAAAVSPAALTRISWTPRRELATTDWLRQGRWLGSLGRAVGWWIGDWLRYGNARYGERYTAAARITGYDQQTLMNMVYVASRVEVARRREALSFSHHAEVAALPAAEQERWLEFAEREGLSVRSLREMVRRRRGHDRQAPLGELRSPTPHAGDSLTPSAPTRADAVCPACGHQFPHGPS